LTHSKEYDSYIKSDAWQQKRAERLQIADFKCEMCGRPEARTKNGLQVHHISYQRLGDEDVFNDLICLCPSCHQRIHAYYRRVRSPRDIKRNLPLNAKN
jgi:predicted HNH restriction endonuclease